MGVEIFRGNNSRCPSYLVCGLMVMCLFLLCNWWSLSSQNFELLKQIDNLAEQLRVTGEELEKCTQQKSLFEEKLKDSQNRFVQQQIKIEQVKEAEDEAKENYEKIDTELKESKKKSESFERNLEICNTEMKSLKKLSESKDKALATLRTESESLKSDIIHKDEEILELKEKISSSNTNAISRDKFAAPPLLKPLGIKIKNIQEKEVNNNKIEQKGNSLLRSDPSQMEKDVMEEVKNEGDILSVDNDPREQEMNS